MGMRLQGNFEWTCEGDPKSKECRRLRYSIRYNGVYMKIYTKSGRFIVNLGGIAEVLSFCPFYRDRGFFYVK